MDLVELQQMSQVKTTEADKSQLIDIYNIQIDNDEPIAQRMESFINQIQNPYCFLCEGVVVKLSYNSEGKSLNEKLEEHFIRKKAE